MLHNSLMPLSCYYAMHKSNHVLSLYPVTNILRTLTLYAEVKTVRINDDDDDNDNARLLLLLLFLILILILIIIIMKNLDYVVTSESHHCMSISLVWCTHIRWPDTYRVSKLV